MVIKQGDHLPDGDLTEYVEVATETCPVGQTTLLVQDLVKGKKIVVFGLPGAFTQTCSSQHLPGYIRLAPEFKAKGVDEIWCISVNDAFVMGAWGRDQKATGIVRMLADGNATYTRALGLTQDLSRYGRGIRSQRYSMLVEDGVVTRFNLETEGKFDVSKAERLLEQF
jgi:peroxiredoxin